MQPTSSVITQQEEEEEEEAAASSSSLFQLFDFNHRETYTLNRALHPHQNPIPMENLAYLFQQILTRCIYRTSSDIRRYNLIRILLLMYPNIITTRSYGSTPLFRLTSITDIETYSVPIDIILKLISPESLSISCYRRAVLPWHVHTPLENAFYWRNRFMIKILLQHATSQHFPSIAIIIRLIHGHIPLQHLTALCIKSALASKTDSAYATLGLPPSLINFTKTLNLDYYYSPPIPDYLPRPSIRPSIFHHLHID